MARNGPLPRPRRGGRTAPERTAARTPSAVPADPPPNDAAAPGDDVTTVYGWLSRLTAQPAEAEELLVEILRRSTQPVPACLRAASDTTRLQFLTIQSVLLRRGVL